MRFVPIKGLQPGMIVARDIINSSKTLMLRKGIKLDGDMIQHMYDQGYMGAYISDLFSEELEIEETIDQSLFADGVRAIKEENIGASVSVAAAIVSDISRKLQVELNLLDLRSTDDYTYHHSVNVAVYSVVVGKKMGLNEQELRNLSVAAICHDLGKMRISTDILQKPDKLSDEEYKEMQNHPRYSYDMLYDFSEISSVVRQAVLCHHENMNGSGYPLGKQGDEIPLLARIIHAVDVYDALTSRRSYKDPYQPIDAFQYLIGGKEILFDSDVVDAVLEVVPAFPPGIDILLSNGESGLVVANTSNALRPKVKIAGSGEIVNLLEDEGYSEVEIVKSGIMPMDYVGEIGILNEDRQAVRKVKETILVVDDISLEIKQVKAILEPDYNVRGVKSGYEAIRYLKNHPPVSLILMDVDMPLMDGITTAVKIKELGGNQIPLIFLTGNCDKSMVLRCKAVGAVDYILKPAKPIYLRERIDVALHKENE